MRSHMLAAAALTAAILPLTGAAAGAPEQAAIRAREAAFYQAFLDADRAAMDDVLAADFAYQHGSGLTIPEAAFLDLIGSGSVAVTQADAPDLTFRDFGDVIVTYGQGPVAGQMSGQQFGGVLRFVNVWGRDGGTWRLHHRNSQFLPQPAAGR